MLPRTEPQHFQGAINPGIARNIGREFLPVNRKKCGVFSLTHIRTAHHRHPRFPDTVERFVCTLKTTLTNRHLYIINIKYNNSWELFLENHVATTMGRCFALTRENHETPCHSSVGFRSFGFVSCRKSKRRERSTSLCAVHTTCVIIIECTAGRLSSVAKAWILPGPEQCILQRSPWLSRISPGIPPSRRFLVPSCCFCHGRDHSRSHRERRAASQCRR